MYMRLRWKDALLTATMICASAALGQTPAVEQQPASTAPAQPIPVVHMTSNLVMVDVVVTNKEKAVHGLDRSKFRLFEDGREQSIANFDEYQPDAVPAALHAPPVLPPHTYSNTPYYPANDVVNVLLLDALNTPQADQMRTRQQMIEYMGKIQPGTMMAVFTLSSRLRMVTGFTADVAQQVKALDNPQTTHASLAEANQQTVNDQIASAANAAMIRGGATTAAHLRQFATDLNASQTGQQVSITLEALRQLARYMSGIPGRKNLIWFSGSFPLSLSPASGGRSFRGVTDYEADVRQTSQLLSAARVAVYPVDAQGLTSLPSFDANYSGRVTPGGRVGRNNSQFTQQVAAEEGSMELIAEQTGGQAYVGTNGLKEAVAKAVENGASYYTIAYVPDAKQIDGKFHAINVRLDSAHYKLAYRRGYYADSADKPTANNPGKSSILAEAIVFDTPPATQILFKARVLPASDPQFAGAKLPNGPAGEMTATLKGETHRYVADLVIDAHTLDLEKTPDGLHHVAIECVVVGYDGDGNRLNWEDATFTVALRPEQYAGILATGLPLRMQLDLPAGRAFLRVAVKDISADHSGSLEVPLAVAAK
jgi:VWFA-related protein